MSLRSMLKFVVCVALFESGSLAQAQGNSVTIARTPIVMSGSQHKVLVSMVQDDQLLGYQLCRVRIDQFKTNRGVIDYLNDGLAKCEDLNSSRFDLSDSRSNDLLAKNFSRALKEQGEKNVRNAQMKGHLLAAAVTGSLALVMTGAGYAYARNFRLNPLGPIAGKVVGIPSMMLGIALGLLASSAAKSAAENALASPPVTVESIYVDFKLSHQLNDSDLVDVTPEKLFDAVAAAVDHSTTRVFGVLHPEL